MIPTVSPKVSVCIPTYNYGEFISDAIESVLAQTFTDFELIVVDNCSTDGTRELVEHYVTSDSRVTYYINEINLGMVGNWNRCLGYARGEYVKILCADDTLTSDCLQKQSDLLDSHENVLLVSSQRSVTDAALKPVSVLKLSDDHAIVDGRHMIKKCLLEWNLIGEPTAVLFRKNSAKRGFDTEYKQVADMEMWFYILESGSFGYIPEPLCCIRQHDEQTTRTNIMTNGILYDELKLYCKYIGKKYIKLSFFKKEKIKFLKAYSIWIDSKNEDIDVARSAIGKYYNIKLFILLLMLKKLKNFICNNKIK